MSRSKTKTVKMSLVFLEFLDKIKEFEAKRGRTNTSYSEAGNILMKRVEEAGGLRGYE